MSQDKAATLPKMGKSPAEISQSLSALRHNDADWRGGRTGAYVFWASDEILRVAQDAYLTFFSENGLSPKAFPSLYKLEREVLEITAHLLRGETAVGSMTSGGTESIMVAVKTARDKARHERGIQQAEMVLPRSAHPAFDKAAHYLGIKAIRTPLKSDFTADVSAIAEAITDKTVLVVGSAPQYPHGVIDPIPEIAAAAKVHDVPVHVDACVGGFFLPFLRKLNPDITDFDFSVPGVTSISADLHKFGFTAKGASTVLYRDNEFFKYQGFSFTDWPIGQYSSPTIAGTRPGGAIAAAWAVLNFLGEEGYLELNKKIMAITHAFFRGINAIPELQVWGNPVMGCFGYGSSSIDMSAVANGMTDLDWLINRQTDPPGIHMFVTPVHESVVDEYISDLETVVERVRTGETKGSKEEITYS